MSLLITPRVGDVFYDLYQLRDKDKRKLYVEKVSKIYSSTGKSSTIILIKLLYNGKEIIIENWDGAFGYPYAHLIMRRII